MLSTSLNISHQLPSFSGCFGSFFKKRNSALDCYFVAVCYALLCTGCYHPGLSAARKLVFKLEQSTVLCNYSSSYSILDRDGEAKRSEWNRSTTLMFVSFVQHELARFTSAITCFVLYFTDNVLTTLL